MTIHQISVFLENRAGQLADITGILSDNHVDLRAINIAETADYGVLRLIVDDAQRASSIRHADKILVLDDGLPAGIGTHEELLKGCEVYREICLSQLSEEEVRQ